MFTSKDFWLLDRLYKKRTSPESGHFRHGVHFIGIPLWLSYFLRHQVQPKVVALIINFLFLNFTSIEIEGERVSSSQNERTWGGGQGQTVYLLENEQRQTRREEGVKTRESWANVLLNVP